MPSNALHHPLTGTLLRPVGYRKDGRAIWPILGGSEPPAAPADTPPADTPPAQVVVTPPAAPAFQWDGNVESLPADVQKVIRDARDDAAKSRTNAKATAAQEARQQLAQEIGKALGLVQGDEPPDPAKLTEQLTGTQTENKTLRVEIAVIRSALKNSADVDALSDSRSFLSKVGALDPSADDFAAKVDAAVLEAISTNPKLKAGRVPGASGADHPGGSGDGPRQPASLEEAVAQKLGA